MNIRKLPTYYLCCSVSAVCISNIHDTFRQYKKQNFLIPHHMKYVKNAQTSENRYHQLDNVVYKSTLKDNVIEGLLFPVYPLVLLLKKTEDNRFYQKNFQDIELELEKEEIKREVDKLPDMKHVNIVKKKLYYHK